MSEIVLSLEQIKEMLPHREPFLFIDAVTKLEANLIEGYRDIKAEEFYFAGHFPGLPTMPGVLMVEAIAQAGILLVCEVREPRRGRKTLFAGIEKVRFRRQVAYHHSCHLRRHRIQSLRSAKVLTSSHQ